MKLQDYYFEITVTRPEGLTTSFSFVDAVRAESGDEAQDKAHYNWVSSARITYSIVKLYSITQ